MDVEVVAFLAFFAVAMGAVILWAIVEANKTPEQKAQDLIRENEFRYGSTNPKLHCPHCQVTGQVRAKPVTRKKGISGGKAAAAVLTGGVSMLATGLSRKEKETQAHCDNCQSTWTF